MQGQPQPKGRYKEICAVFCDRFRFPWIHGARKVELEVLLPAFIVPAAMWIGTFGVILTIFSFVFILVAIHVTRKCMLLRKRGTKFYCSFTITSFLLSYLVSKQRDLREVLWKILEKLFNWASLFLQIFEFKVNKFEGISQWDYWLYVFLFCMTLSLMYQTRVKGREDRSLAAMSDKLPAYYFCRTCQFYVNGRDHHCVWLHCCIGRENKPWFLVAIIVGCCWIIYTIYITLKVVCDPIEFFNGSVALPLSCSSVYQNYE